MDFYVAKHDYENGLNGSGRTLVVRKDCYDTRQWHTSNVNAYATSAIDTWLNSTYKNLLDADIRGVIGTTKIKYTPGNGNTTVGTLERAIFLLSVTELGRSASYANTEGTALSIASSLQIAYLNGSAVVQWTRSPSTSITGSAYYLRTGGNVSDSGCSSTYGSRPAFTLPSTLSVSDDGSVSVNTAPTISGSYATGTNLGTKTAGFNLTYTVADADGDTVTVKEYLDNVLQRTYTATLGATNTFQCVTAANFQTVLNGAHTLKVVANDGKADSAAYTITFTKKVTKATITLASALPADDIIQVMVMALTSSIPADANLKVLVTNNANDSSPVWEDATADIKNGVNHVFTNKTAANGFAFNFKLSVERGASDTGGYISNIGGAFE
ncbi:MAG: hypothetical protein BHV93_12440 [Clostridiales bacterium 52_15]|nr:MAG: hypothetical protein BHV93_12440 [Clostridiales bacterium 52_15]